MQRHGSMQLFLLSLVLGSCGGSEPKEEPGLKLRGNLDLPTIAGGTSSTGSGNWGYTAPDGRRFALTGTSAGLSIVDVSKPKSPRKVALIPGPHSLWREVKTYSHYAYVTTEANHGLDIVDLADPDHPRL